MSKLIAAVGLPRSGKSSWARHFEIYEDQIQYFKDMPQEVLRERRVIVNGDAIRKALHGDVYHKESESHVFAIAEVMIRSLLETGHTVIWDECNTSLASLYGIFKLDPDAHIQYFSTPEETCINRAKLLNQDYLIPVIQRSSKNITFIKSLCHPYDLASGANYIREFVRRNYSLNQLIQEISC
jgi:predicted kinase